MVILCNVVSLDNPFLHIESPPWSIVTNDFSSSKKKHQQTNGAVDRCEGTNLSNTQTKEKQHDFIVDPFLMESVLTYSAEIMLKRLQSSIVITISLILNVEN